MSNLNIQFETEQTIHQDTHVRSNLKRKQEQETNSIKRKTKNIHEICKFFFLNSDKTKIICQICNQSYVFNTNTSNLKKHFEIFHKKEYEEILKQEALKKDTTLIRSNEVKEKNQQAQTENETDLYKPPESFKIVKNNNYKKEINCIEIEEGSIEIEGIKISGKYKITFK